MATEFSFRTARNIIAGNECTRNITRHLLRLGTPRAVLVVTQPPIARSDGVRAIFRALEDGGITCETVEDVGVEPSIDNLTEIHKRTGSFDCDAVIGIGGGSALDAAKLLSVMRTNTARLEELIGTDRVEAPGVPLCLIPTTAGTGSEVTPNAIVSVPEKELKEGVVSEHLLPGLSFVDPTLTYSLPRHVTAATGLDAFIHSFESFFSKRANPISDMFALRSMSLISKSIVSAYRNPTDAAAREAMMYGALYGGMALTSSGTTAVHALAYPLGGKYKIAHGVANAMLLPHVFAFNLDVLGDRVLPVVEAMGLPRQQDWQQGAHAILDRITVWMSVLEIPQDLGEYGIGNSDVAALSTAAAKVTRLLVNNPKEMTEQDIAGVYRKLLHGTAQ